MSYAAAARAIADARSIIVTTHINPDGDGVGAGLALVHALERKRKKVRFCCPSAVVSLYAFLPGYERITFLYLGYVRDLEANPPGEGWDAAFTLYEK